MIEQFREAMAAANIECAVEIVPDGKLHRFKPNGGRNPDGWYCLHGDGIPAGSFGNWKTGQSFTWCQKKQSELSPEERKAYQQRIEQQKQAREAEEKRTHEQAAEKAKWIWDHSTPATEDHPYLQKKQVKPYGLRIAKDGRLIIPARDASGTIRTLQFISGDGTKRFLPGGQKAGHFFEIPGDTDTVYIGEGFATMATVHMATGGHTIIAFDAGNLVSVSQTIRRKYPKAEIVICADNDAWTEGNPGITKARQAARAIRAQVVVPKFKDVSSKPSDFNDLHILEGIETVKQQLTQAAVDPDPEPEVELMIERAESKNLFPYQAMTGAAGSFADAYTHYLETPQHFLFMAYLTCLGSIISDRVTLDSELQPQTRLFTVLLGDSADVRKSTSISKAVSLFKETIEGFKISWGINSAEGLQKRLKKNETEGSSNLLLIFDEFKSFVSKCRIDTSALLPCVNTLFESNCYESHTKNKSVTLEDAHLSLLAASTTQTYERIWDRSFTDIGFNNRLFLVPGSGERKFSMPEKMPNEDLEQLKRELARVLEHTAKHPLLKLTPEAKRLYHEWYMTLEASVHSKRLDTYAARLMILLAVNNLKTEVDTETVSGVIALCDWQLEVRKQYDPIDSDNVVAIIEEKIRRTLRKRPQTERELKQNTNAHRDGLWLFGQALKNLSNAHEIKWQKSDKKWNLETV